MVSKGVLSVILAGTAAVLLLLAGCGSGGGDTPPTKEAFLREANTVCAKGQAEREEVMKKALAVFHGTPTQAQKEEYILDLLPSYEDATQNLGELQPPAGDENKLDAMVAA